MSLIRSIRYALGIKPLSLKDKAVLALRQSPLGSTIADDIADLSNKEMPGREKFERVVERTLPAILAIAQAGGAEKVLLGEVDDIARALVQSVFNDQFSTKAGKIAVMVLAALR